MHGAVARALHEQRRAKMPRSPRGYGLGEEDAWSAFLSHPVQDPMMMEQYIAAHGGNVDERILLLIEGLPSGERTAHC